MHVVISFVLGSGVEVMATKLYVVDDETARKVAAILEGDAPPAPPAPGLWVTIANHEGLGLTLRAKPYRTSANIGWVDNGKTYPVFGQQKDAGGNNWVNIGNGWIAQVYGGRVKAVFSDDNVSDPALHT